MGGPSGTITFLFTDIEGSTRLWQQDEVAMRAALSRHDELLREVIVEHGGVVFSTMGDGVAAAFTSAVSAVAAAQAAQERLTAETWPTATPIRVRVGLHTGEAELRDGDYFGNAVNRAARLMAAGHGGQVLVSETTAGLVDAVPLLDLGEHRLRDLSAAQRVFQLGEGRFPRLRSVDAVPGNLPTMLTELVGRAEDLADLVTLIERERLVTLTGVGGVGKTSLALAVAAGSTGSFLDGCWFAELASASTGEEVVRAVAGALGTPATALDGLARFLADRQVLIVLDNCEHVLSHAARLAEGVLGAGPEAAIIATSREPLGVRGEVVRGVRSLTVPDDVVSAAEAVAASAVGLFVARATSASEQFTLDDSNVEAVVEICRHLDGIPLAIELAAARVRGMGTAEIARRLSERFRLLTASKGSLERHRTLLGTVVWSHELLTDEERRVFRRLAVFPASFDLGAAEAVGGAEESVDVMECVLRLVDRSLVVYDPSADRYRLLETLRQYGADQLAEAVETNTARDRHAGFYLGVASQNASAVGDLSVPAARRFEAEMDNLRAVVDLLRHQTRWGDLLRLCGHLYSYVANRAPFDGYLWYRDATEHLSDVDEQERVDALGNFAWLAMSAGQAAFGDPTAASIALAEAAGVLHSPQAWMARTVAVNAIDPTQARQDAEVTLAVAEERGDRYSALNALGLLACVLANVGQLDRSAELAAATLERARLVSHPDALAQAVIAAAGSYLTARADPDFAEGMRILEANPLDSDSVGQLQSAWLHRMWGLAHLGLAQVDPALPHLTSSLRSADRAGHYGLLDEAALALSVALGEAGDSTLAAKLDGYVQAHGSSQSIRDPSHTWLRERLAAVMDPARHVEWEVAAKAGAKMDRRGFLRLLADAERNVGSSSIP